MGDAPEPTQSGGLLARLARLRTLPPRAQGVAVVVAALVLVVCAKLGFDLVVKPAELYSVATLDRL